MKLLTALVLLVAHVPLLKRTVHGLKRDHLPGAAEFFAASFCLYFDLEIIFEAFGGGYSNVFFRPFFHADDCSLALAIAIIVATPWIVYAGSSWYAALHIDAPVRQTTALRRPILFYGLTAAICISISCLSIIEFLNSSSLWAARAQVGASFGPLIIVFYMPMGILAFYIRQIESKSRFGTLFIAFLVATSILSSLAEGERTLTLLPLLIVAVFRGTLSTKRIIRFAILLLLGASVSVPLFKSGSQGSDLKESINWVFAGDIARAPVLIESIHQSDLVGTSVLNYPGAGYAYFAMFFVPRGLVPFKGISHGHVFTGRIVNKDPDSLNWAFGIGPADDAMLNFGIASVPGVLFVYGIAFGFLDRISLRVPVVAVLGRLAAVWMAGYGIGACFFLFGPIAVAGVACHSCFATRIPIHRSSRLRTTPPPSLPNGGRVLVLEA